MSSAEKEIASEKLAEIVSPADRRALTDGLSEHLLNELLLILAASEDTLVARAIVAEVLAAIPEYSDRAVIVALARVSHANESVAPVGDGESGS